MNSGSSASRSGITGISAPISAAVMTACTPGMRSRGGCVDAADAAVRDAAAQDHRVQHAGALEIVDELAAAGEKARVLGPIDRLTDQRPCWQVHE